MLLEKRTFFFLRSTNISMGKLEVWIYWKK